LPYQMPSIAHSDAQLTNVAAFRCLPCRGRVLAEGGQRGTSHTRTAHAARWEAYHRGAPSQGLQEKESVCGHLASPVGSCTRVFGLQVMSKVARRYANELAADGRRKWRVADSGEQHPGSSGHLCKFRATRVVQDERNARSIADEAQG